jgi:hypothetical protein
MKVALWTLEDCINCDAIGMKNKTRLQSASALETLPMI